LVSFNIFKRTPLGRLLTSIAPQLLLTVPQITNNQSGSNRCNQYLICHIYTKANSM
jgi:hypothetical protein